MSSRKAGKSYTRDIRGLRDALFDEIEDLRDGASSPHEAVAFCSLSEQVLESFNAGIKRHAYMLSVEEKRLSMQERKVALDQKKLFLLEAQKEFENEKISKVVVESDEVQTLRISHRYEPAVVD
jgi:hypothetical protein